MIKTRILQGNLMVLSSHLPQNHSYVTTGWWSQTRSERGGHGKQSKLSVETMQPLRPEWVGEFAHPAVNTRSSIPTGKHHTYSTDGFPSAEGSVLWTVLHWKGPVHLHTKDLLFAWLSLGQCPYRKSLGNTRHIPAEIIRDHPVWPFKNRWTEMNHISQSICRNNSIMQSAALPLATLLLQYIK